MQEWMCGTHVVLCVCRRENLCICVSIVFVCVGIFLCKCACMFLTVSVCVRMYVYVKEVCVCVHAEARRSVYFFSFELICIYCFFLFLMKNIFHIIYSDHSCPPNSLKTKKVRKLTHIHTPFNSQTQKDRHKYKTKIHEQKTKKIKF